MTLSTALCAAVGALATGTAALWPNARRAINRALALFALFVAGWLFVYHAGAVRPPQFGAFRAVWFLAGCFPLALVLLRETAVGARSFAELARRGQAWVGFAVLDGVAVFSPWFARAGDDPDRLVYSAGYYTVLALGIAAAAVFTVSCVLRMRGQLGLRRLELQLIALGGSALLLSMHVLPLLGAVTHDTTWDRLMPLALLAVFGGLAWSLLTHRLLDARLILTLAVEKLILVAAASAFVWGVQQLAVQFIPEWLSFGLAIALGLWFVAEIRPWLQDVFQRKAGAERVRRAVFEIARKELRPEKLGDAFETLLRDWADAERAVVFMASQGRLIGGGSEWAIDRPELRLLQGLRWATPERLDRERPRTDADALANWMRSEGFGLLVANGGPALTFVTAVGTPRSQRPFTYPEIAQVIGLQSTIESAMSRAHYLMKAQHAEQLATVGVLGASIAHEIRNPLVSIKTFVQLLPLRYQEEAFREKFFRLIGDEVGRIDRLTEQLLDLSAPRVFSSQEVAIHMLLSSCVELIAAKADDRGVTIATDFKAQNDVVYTDPSAIKQVILNLGFNAIQALEQQAGEKLVKLTTSQIAEGLEVTIEDNGPGISPQVYGRLFQPFQTTKSSGFGLGLAICKDILSSLHASIIADPPAPGTGATFRIILPCQPPTS